VKTTGVVPQPSTLAATRTTLTHTSSHVKNHGEEGGGGGRTAADPVVGVKFKRCATSVSTNRLLHDLVPEMDKLSLMSKLACNSFKSSLLCVDVALLPTCLTPNLEQLFP